VEGERRDITDEKRRDAAARTIDAAREHNRTGGPQVDCCLIPSFGESENGHCVHQLVQHCCFPCLQRPATFQRCLRAWMHNGECHEGGERFEAARNVCCGWFCESAAEQQQCEVCGTTWAVHAACRVRCEMCAECPKEHGRRNRSRLAVCKFAAHDCKLALASGLLVPAVFQRPE